MDPDDARNVVDEQHFWSGLEEIVNAPSENHEQIDDALRSLLDLAAQHRQEYLASEYDIARFCYGLLDAQLFQSNQDYVRRQMLYCLLQEDEPSPLHLSAAVLLFDGRHRESVFEMMQQEGGFPRLVELVGNRSDDEPNLHRVLLELLYEIARIQKLTRDDLMIVDDSFILYLFGLIEDLSDDAEDPYHYPIIRVLVRVSLRTLALALADIYQLALNEQYMCHAQPSPASPESASIPGPLTNRVMKLLSLHGSSYRTFGENLILLINRESSLSPQLLILKLLYLLFTTPSTQEYFYTNDLYVLIDVIIRNLLNIDYGTGDFTMDGDIVERDGLRALRNTYLRVLYPLLKNTQIAQEDSNYKRDEVRKLLHLLVSSSSMHFAPVDETVLRLVLRCRQIDWLREDDDEDDDAIMQRLSEFKATSLAPPTPATVQGLIAKKMLGMSIAPASESSLSVIEVAAKVAKEKPVVPAPRRRRPTTRGSTLRNFDRGTSHADAPPMPIPAVPKIQSPPLPREPAQSQSGRGSPSPDAPRAPATSMPGEHLPSGHNVTVEAPEQSRSPFADDNATA